MKERSKADIEAFLADPEKRPGIADWQVRQAEHALRILYEFFLPGYAPGKHTPSKASQTHPAHEEKAEADQFRDRVIPGEVERQFSTLVQAVKTAVRTLHYSYRTETLLSCLGEAVHCLSQLRRSQRA